MRIRLLSVALALLCLLVATASALAAPGDIVPLAGTGTQGNAGDNGPAIQALLNIPADAVPDGRGGYLIADKKNHVIRRISPDGVIRRVAGTGANGYNGDGIPATTAQLSFPSGVAPLPEGGFLIADAVNNRIRKVDASGKISTIAGLGTEGDSGDGGPATEAQLRLPCRVALLPGGGYLIADFNNHRIRKVDAGGTITTVAGTGTDGYNGDGIQATAAQIDEPSSATPTRDGGFLISEYGGHRVRKVSAAGVIQTIAGTGAPGYNGDGIAATAATLDQPTTAYETVYGSILIADYSNHRIRLVPRAASGPRLIKTVAGTGVDADSGDGGPATAAEIDHPASAVPHPDGGFLIADLSNDRIRRVIGESPPGVCGTGFRATVGGPFADRLTGTLFRDAITGRGRADVLSGLAATDCLLGGAGADQLLGGAGKDRMLGGAAADRLLGGKGADTLGGGPGPDRLTGGPGRDRIRCGPGRDIATVTRGDNVGRNCEVVRRPSA